MRNNHAAVLLPHCGQPAVYVGIFYSPRYGAHLKSGGAESYARSFPVGDVPEMDYYAFASAQIRQGGAGVFYGTASDKLLLAQGKSLGKFAGCPAHILP